MPETSVRTRWQMILMTAIVGLLLALVSERIPVNGGLGMDGVSYAAYARDFGRIVSGESDVIWLRVRRLLPSAVCHVALRAIGAELSTENIILFFRVYNLALLVLATWGWTLVCSAAAIGERGAWLGYVGLFANHLVLKFGFYYPVLTDISAYTFAIFMVYAYFASRPILLAILTVLGSFTWPTLVVLGLTWLAFPRRSVNPDAPVRRGHFVLAGACVGAYAMYAAWGITVPGVLLLPGPSVKFLPISVTISVAYLLIVFSALFRHAGYLNARSLVGAISPFGVALLVATAVLAFWAGSRIAPVGGVLGTGRMALAHLAVLFWDSVMRPGEFLASHPMYFGPLLVLGAVHFRAVLSEIHRCGWGSVLAAGMAFLHFLEPLSRQSLAEYVFLVPFIVLAFERVVRGDRFLAVFAVASVLYSKVWMRFDWHPRFYHSSTGWYMGNFFYFSQLALVALTAGILIRQRKNAEVAAPRAA